MIEVKNLAEQLIYTSEKTLKDNKEKVPADSVKLVEEKIAELKKVKDGSEMSTIKTATETLSQEIQKVGQMLYKQPAPGAQEDQGQPPKDNKGPDGPIRDAETK